MSCGLGGGDDFVGWLAQLKAQIGITGGLAARGVQREQFDAAGGDRQRRHLRARPIRARARRPISSACSTQAL